MTPEEFEHWSRKAADWGAAYHASLPDRPVRAQTAPGEIYRQIGSAPPGTGEAMEAILADFERIILPGMTHWQHPRFFAYFPANAAPVSVVAECLAPSNYFMPLNRLLADASDQLCRIALAHDLPLTS